MQRRIYGRLTKSAKKEAEDWARQTKRTLVMELIKQRKHTWISRPRRQVRFNFHKIMSTCQHVYKSLVGQRSDEHPVVASCYNGSLC